MSEIYFDSFQRSLCKEKPENLLNRKRLTRQEMDEIFLTQE